MRLLPASPLQPDHAGPIYARHDRMSSIDPSVDPTYAVVSYAPKWYILAYADGDKQLRVDYAE